MTTLVRTPSFIDLRAWAEQADRPAPGDFLRARRELELPAGPVSVGIVALAAGRGSAPLLDAHEFVIMLSGAVTLVQDGRAVALAPGESAVLPAGAAFGWHANEPARLIFMRYRGGAGPDQAIARIDEHAPLEPSGPPLAELLLTPTPQCRNHTEYTSPNGTFICGTWDSTPYHRRAMSYRHYELMHLLEGDVSFEDDEGRSRTFVAGDIFLLEQYARCSWESRTHVKKVYAIYRPVA